MLNIQIKEEAKIISSRNSYGSCFWDSIRSSVLRKIINEDISDFASWDEIHKTMYVSNIHGYVKNEYDYIKDKEYIKFVSRNNLKHETTHNGVCSNTIHMLYHIQKFTDTTGVHLKSLNSVVEFGGGFGNMCKVIKNQNNQIDYTIFDFEEFNLLQKYYLNENGITDTKFCNNIENLENKQYDLLVATWSLSEAPRSVRENFLRRVNISNFIIAYQGSFEGVDNNDFFSYMSNNIPEIKWHKVPIEHIGNQNYLFGVKK